MDAIHLSLLTPDDVAAAVALDQQCLGGMWTTEGYLREIDSPNSVLLKLARVDQTAGKIPELVGLGCLWMILDEAHITILAVRPSMQRQGLGQLLLIALLQAAAQQEMARATLEVRASNERAIALYRKFGFADVGVRPRYYQNPAEDALILWRKGLQERAFSDELQQRWGAISHHGQQQGWSLSVTGDTAAFLGLPLDMGIFS